MKSVYIDRRLLAGLLDNLYADWNELQNFFTPQVRLARKERHGARIRRWYDEPKTPFERLLDDPDVTLAAKAELLQRRKDLNPIELRERIRTRLKKIYQYQSVEAGWRGRVSA